MAKKLKTRFIKMEKDVGTASQGGTIKIVGKIPAMKLFMEGIQKAINISPYVVEGLAHHINLGQNFLRENQADMIVVNKS